MMKYTIYMFTIILLTSCYHSEQKVDESITYSCSELIEIPTTTVREIGVCAQNGHAESQHLLATIYIEGKLIPQDPQKAFYWTLQAASQGISAAQINAGWLYKIGLGTKKDFTKAFYWTDKAAKTGNIEALNNLGYFYSHGIGVRPNFKLAMEYYKKAIDKGSLTAKKNLGVAYFHGYGMSKNLHKALELTLPVAMQGDLEAMNNLGSIYLELGKSNEALYWTRKVVNSDPKSGSISILQRNFNAIAQANLSYILALHAQRPSEQEEARQWLEKSKAQNEPFAYFIAGKLYSDKNKAFPLDEAKAYENYLKSAEMGEEAAQYEIAQRLMEGRFIPKNEQLALQWYEKAAENGVQPAVSKLIKIYGKGTQTIPKNEAQKQYWESKLAIE